MMISGYLLILLCVSGDGFLLPNCPHGWLPHNGHCYGFFKHLLSWYDASSACKAHNSYLAAIETSDENIFLKTQSKEIDAYFWVGGEDDLIEGEWTWAETDEPFDFTDWIHGQPDNSKQGEDCLSLWKASAWAWNDLTCETHSYYICEKIVSGSGAIIGKSIFTEEKGIFFLDSFLKTVFQLLLTLMFE